MKYSVLLFISCILVYSRTCLAQPPDNKPLPDIFVGRTPCQELAGQLREITIPECIKIKWKLIIYKDPGSENTGTYNMWGFIYKKDNPRAGKWRLTKGTKTNKEAIVYELEEKGRPSFFLQKAGDNVLFFLDNDKKLMIGNGDFSYTLNRTTH